MKTLNKFQVQLWTVWMSDGHLPVFPILFKLKILTLLFQYNLQCSIPFSHTKCTVLPNCWKYRFFLERLLKVWPLYSDAFCHDRMKSMTSLFLSTLFSQKPFAFLNISDYWPIISPILYFALTFFSVSITREESILAKMFGLQYMLGVPPSGVYITGTYVVGIYALLYCAVSTICEDEIENKRARE